mmetsp:Transcript_29387/g.94102  ORF Transcript_29387/g.94102 Transcript_29387/m.94102 type:complete len:220 (-) Transcript_29387:598-1257(-)
MDRAPCLRSCRCPLPRFLAPPPNGPRRLPPSTEVTWPSWAGSGSRSPGRNDHGAPGATSPGVARPGGRTPRMYCWTAAALRLAFSWYCMRALLACSPGWSVASRSHEPTFWMGLGIPGLSPRWLPRFCRAWSAVPTRRIPGLEGGVGGPASSGSSLAGEASPKSSDFAAFFFSRILRKSLSEIERLKPVLSCSTFCISCDSSAKRVKPGDMAFLSRGVR